RKPGGLGPRVFRVPPLRHLEARPGPGPPGPARGLGSRGRRRRRRAPRGRGDRRCLPGRARALLMLALDPQDAEVLPEELLSRHTTWRIGGPARAYCRVKTERGLAAVLAEASRTGEPLALLGMGSNVLAADEGFPGFVVRLAGAFLEIA